MSEVTNIKICSDTSVVTEILNYAITSILLQRSIITIGSTKTVKKWGIFVAAVNDPILKAYLKTVLKEVSRLISLQPNQVIILSLINENTNVAVERWQFYLEPRQSEPSANTLETAECLPSIGLDFQAVQSSINNSSVFLPILRGPHTFTIAIKNGLSDDACANNCWEAKNYEPLQHANAVAFPEVNTEARSLRPFVIYSMVPQEDR